MLKRIAYRLIQSLITLLIVTMLTFGLLAAAGGDAVTELVDNPNVSQATIEQSRRVYGLDKPLMERYRAWLSCSSSTPSRP